MCDRRVGVVFWEPGDGLATAVCETLTGLGHHPRPLDPAAPLPADLDLVFVWGPLGSLLPLARQLRSMPSPPRLVVWQTEQSWDPRLPLRLTLTLSALRSALERRWFARGQRPDWMKPLFRRGKRFRYVGDLRWLQRQGLLGVLAVPTAWYAGFLRQCGLPAITAYIGGHPSWGADLGLDRDIPVLWLGKTGSARRARLLGWLDQALQARGIPLMRVDGVAHPYVFGEERTHLLNRTRIVINLLRQPWDANALRFYLAALNGAMILSEPTLAHNPFVPGEHIVSVPFKEMADAVVYYLSHDAERERIARAARQLVLTGLSMRSQIARIMSAAEVL